MPAMNELDAEFSRLQARLERLKADGKDKVKGGEYDSVLKEMSIVSKARIAHLTIKGVKAQ